MDRLLQDLRFGARLLWRDKGFTVTAVTTLAICLGANTAIFGVVNSVLLHPLRVNDPERVALMFNSYPKAGVEGGSSGVPDYYDRLRETDVFESQALYTTNGRTIGTDAAPERVMSMDVTPSIFQVLQVQPAIGRTFTQAEGELGQERRAILSHALWLRLSGGDRSIVGRELRVDGQPYTVVGVMPEGFQFISPDVRIWTPLAFTAEEKSDEARHNNSWQNIGRLKPGATMAQAQSQIDALNVRNLDRFPALKEVLINAGFRTVVTPLQDRLVRDIRPALYLLWAGVAFVLLIGCVNIANLTLVRSTVRMKELATRYALGAGEWRMARQILTETTLLTLMGGILGLVIGRGLLTGVERLGLEELPSATAIGMDFTVVAFGIALSLVVGVIVGAIPMVRVMRADLGSLVREEGRSGTASRRTLLVRRMLVTVQVAVALVLLVGSGLLFSSFRQLLAVDPGFRAERVLTGMVDLPVARYESAPSQRTFFARLLEKVRALPGVTAAGATSHIPLGGNYSDSVILAEGYEMKPGESLISPNRLEVTPGYFEAMGVALRRGRYFTDADTGQASRVVIVDDLLARRFFGDANPIGRRLIRITKTEDLPTPGPDVPRYEIVGVVASMKFQGLVDPPGRVGAYYFPFEQDTRRTMTLAVKTIGQPTSVTAEIQRQLSSLDPELPFYEVRTMEERIDRSLVSRRTPMVLAVGFGIVALLLSAIGIYGVLAYQVAQRTKEIGIRMALGSETRQIFALVLREGLAIVAVGLGLGLAGALAIGRALESQLYGVRASDPRILAAVGAALSIIALLACVIPARRAARVNPVTALE
jgi:predicted permease